jgi:transcriptional regulator with XRE-family HTH domain
VRSESEELDQELEELHRFMGVRVREARLAKGLSQQELAKKARIHRSYLGEIEQGLRNPSTDVVWLLARGCEVRVTDFYPTGPG